jgi:antitoxin (DNA-binding transcriptional repressor) of toxin-antitoxin stability system
MLYFLQEGRKMKSVNIRELTHHFSDYLKAVKRGNRVVVMERRVPVADIVPHNENVASPDWRRPIQRIRIKGETFSRTTIRSRAEE